MQRWEYIRVNGGGPQSGDMHINEIPEWDYQGRQGWELISVQRFPMPDEEGRYLVWGYFKRPIGSKESH